MTTTPFVESVLNFLDGEVLETVEYGKNEVTVRLKNVNRKIDGADWDKRIIDHLNHLGYTAHIRFGDGAWATISKIS